MYIANDYKSDEGEALCSIEKFVYMDHIENNKVIY